MESMGTRFTGKSRLNSTSRSTSQASRPFAPGQKWYCFRTPSFEELRHSGLPNAGPASARQLRFDDDGSAAPPHLAAVWRGRGPWRSSRPALTSPVPSSQEVVVVNVFAAAAASWGVAMALAPLLQIHRIRRTRSSASVSVAYQQVLLVGFVLWLSYGIAAANVALIIPNTVAVVVGAAVIVATLRYR